MTTAILIEPFTKTVTEVDLDVNSLDEIYALLKCPTIDALEFNKFGDVVIVDDEGMLANPDKQGYFQIHVTQKDEIFDTILAGMGLVVGALPNGEWGRPVEPFSEILARISSPDFETIADFLRQT